MFATASNALSVVTKDVTVRGDGAGRFLVATLGDFGVEFYADGSQFIIDPAISEELQGERKFQTMDEAMNYALGWLTHANSDSVAQHPTNPL